jgi:hypothetical protein
MFQSPSATKPVLGAVYSTEIDEVVVKTLFQIGFAGNELLRYLGLAID